MKPLTYLINCAPEGAEAEWYQAAEESKDSEDVIAVIAYSEYQAQAQRIAELEAATEHLGLTPQQAADGLVRYKAQVAEIESLRKQVEELKICKLVSDEYNAWIYWHNAGGEYDSFLVNYLASKNGE